MNYRIETLHLFSSNIQKTYYYEKNNITIVWLAFYQSVVCPLRSAVKELPPKSLILKRDNRVN